MIFKKFNKKLFTSFSKDIGIDLGTANTLVYVKNKGVVIREPSVVALNTKNNQILAIGEEARRMVGKTPQYVVAVRPLVDGVISDFEVTEKMVRYFIDKVYKSDFSVVRRPRVVVGVPLDVTEVERKAVEDAVTSAGAKDVFLIEESMAAAIGCNLPIQEPIGNMIVDIGGGTTEISVISLGGVVTAKTLKIAGDELNRNIVSYARENFNILLGEKVAEKVKVEIGSACSLDEPLETQMRGRDLISGLPKQIIVNDKQIREALGRSVKNIVESIKATLEITPPELVADIYERGILLTGGGALLKNLDRAISQAAGIPVYVADDPLTAVVRGTGMLLDDIDLLKLVSITPE